MAAALSTTVSNHYETNVLGKPMRQVHSINTLKCLLGSSRSVNIDITLIWSVREFVAGGVNITNIRHHSNSTATQLQLGLQIRGKTIVMRLFIYLKSHHTKLALFTLTSTIHQADLMVGNLSDTVTYSLTAALDQLRVVASSTSNDPGPW